MTHTLIFPTQPILQPVAGARRLFDMYEDWKIALDGRELIVKKGFRTDLASIPKVFEGVINNDDPRILCASIVHDLGFATQGKFWHDAPAYSFTEVNEVLLAGMRSCGANEVICAAVFAAVETGGFLIWQRESLNR